MIPDNKTLLELENIYRLKIISINNEIEETKKSSDEAYKNFLKEELDKNVKNFVACIPLHSDYEMICPIFKGLMVDGVKTISFYIENHLEYSIFEDWIFLCFDFAGKRFDGGCFSLESTIEENIEKNKKELEKEPQYG